MHALIVDGTNNFIRQYVVNPHMDANGESIGGVVGFLRSLKNFLKELRPEECIVVWDGKGGSAKRRSIYGEYKAGRKPHLNREYDFGSPEEGFRNMLRQRDQLKRYLSLLGICQMQMDDVEADDVIAYLARHELDSERKTIVSTDRDFLQLVDERTQVYNPIKKLYYGKSTFLDTMGVLPQNYIWLKALIGDGSDNVKGIKGVGQKTAIKHFPVLAQDPVDSLEDLLAYAQEKCKDDKVLARVLEQRERLVENVQLMQLTKPMLSSSTARSIRASLNGERTFNGFDARLAIVRDGIQLSDSDLFGPYKDFWTRHQNVSKETRPT